VIVFFLFVVAPFFGQTKTVHVFVALCDNINQGIVPVPEAIGNGQDPKNNLYWGAGYGIKSFFKLKTKDWVFVKMLPAPNAYILERILFKHAKTNTYMLADAYDGAAIKTCIEDFLKASNHQDNQCVKENGIDLGFGGASDLVAYVGHDGLMEFNVNIDYMEHNIAPKETIVLACYSKSFFKEELLKANAKPLVWTTHLMAPEAYTIKAALDGWLLGENDLQIEERAAQAYHKYQKCGIRGARNLFTTGF